MRELHRIRGLTRNVRTTNIALTSGLRHVCRHTARLAAATLRKHRREKTSTEGAQGAHEGGRVWRVPAAFTCTATAANAKATATSSFAAAANNASAIIASPDEATRERSSNTVRCGCCQARASCTDTAGYAHAVAPNRVAQLEAPCERASHAVGAAGKAAAARFVRRV